MGPILYLPTLRYGFVWDDNRLIVNNQNLAESSPFDVFFRNFWFNPSLGSDPGDMTYYRPLSNLSFVLERREYGLEPFGYHLTNVLLHAGVAMMAALVFLELLGSPILAAAGALVIGIHPATNCIPAFVSGRPYLLVTLMLLVSFYALVRGSRGPGLPVSTGAGSRTVSRVKAGAAKQRADGRPWLWLFGASFLLALFSLESGLAFVVVVGVWLATFTTSEARRASTSKSSVLNWVWAGLGAIVVYLVFRLWVAKTGFPSAVGTWAIQEPLRILGCLGHQTWLFFYPFNPKVIYVLSQEFQGFSANSLLGLAFLILPIATALVLRSQAALLGAVWALAFMLPSAHLLFLGPSGRSLYLAGFGWVLFVLALVRRARGPGLILRVVAITLYVGYTVAFAIQLLRRNPIWQSEETLYQAMVTEAPESAGAHLNLGAVWEKSGRLEEARRHYEIAVALDPDYLAPRNRLAFALVQAGDYKAAVREFNEIVRRAPSADAYNNLALTLRLAGQVDSAITVYRAALRVAPSSDTTWNNLGWAYLANSDLPAAITAFRQALSLDPGFLAARASLAQAFRAAGLEDSARLVEEGLAGAR
ncbi:MAG: tetratricopeptide repeat protein [candidate division WOR-3 bacterium]